MAKAGATLDEVVEAEEKKPTEPAQPAPKPAAVPQVVAPVLPDAKSSTAAGLEHKVVTLYGPPGVGKTTLASQWAGGGGFFMNVAGELGDLNVFQLPCPSFRDAKLLALAIKENPTKYPCTIIDTADKLGQFCSDAVRKNLGISHESDAEYGKGWTLVRDEFGIFLAKLASIPNHGLILVTHSTDEKVKTRNAEWTKFTIRGQKGIKESILDLSDLVLYIDFAEDDDKKRVIKTKPNRLYDAKERGEKPRLPDEINWPLGTNGFDLLKDLWEKGGKK